MSVAHVNGIRVFYEVSGSGPAGVALVHGSWGSHENWNPVVAGLSEAFRTLAYDRRGHSDSERPAGQGSVHEDVADLAALLEQLRLAPAFVAGNSFGAAIALRLAGERPDLVRGVVAHEPPLFQLLADESAVAPMLEDLRRRVGAVAQRIAEGDSAGAAQQFAETVALGPGTWAQLPADVRETMIANAPTFLDETNDPEARRLDLEALRRFDRPVLLTRGALSPPIYDPVIHKLAGVLPRSEVFSYPASGHVPYVTQPELWVTTVSAFVRKYAQV